MVFSALWDLRANLLVEVCLIPQVHTPSACKPETAPATRWLHRFRGPTPQSGTKFLNGFSKSSCLSFNLLDTSTSTSLVIPGCPRAALCCQHLAPHSLGSRK